MSAPPAFAVSRKRKRLHLIEDSSPEPQPSASPRIRRTNSLDAHDELGSSEHSTSHYHSQKTMPRAGSEDGPGPSSHVHQHPALELPTGGLNRGFACLGCRKRKSKCDTNRPSCDQCIKAKMPCVYDDRPQKRPTEVLKERIRDLEEKVRQLERQNPGLAAALAKSQSATPSSSTSPGAISHTLSAGSSRNPYDQASQSQPWIAPGASTSNYPFPTNASGMPSAYLPPSDMRSTDAYGFPTAAGQAIPGVGQFLLNRQGRVPDPSIFAIAPDTSNDPLPPDLDQNELLTSFVSHRHQAYCDISVNRFLQSLTAPISSSSSSSSSSNSHPNSPSQPHHAQPQLQRPHASLLNAAYLLGAFFSGSPRLAAYEPMFLHRARQGIASALENAERLENAVQAASLVSMYLYAKGRVLEGYYLSCANARFAMGCGMHRIASPVWGAATSGGAAGGKAEDDELGVSTMPLLEDPKDPIELGERIHIWWQVWMVDQCGAISTNLPPALSDTTDPLARIDTCFPPEMVAFESGGVLALDHHTAPTVGGEWETLRSLYEFPPSHAANRTRAERERALGRNSMVAKAIELFSRAWKLSKHDVKDEKFRLAFEATDDAIRRFSATLPRTLNAAGGLSHGLFLPHSFALAAIIQLHWIVAVEHNHLHPSYQNCLNAAIDMVAIIDVIQPGDYALLELHIGTCWKLTVDVLWREYSRVQNVDDGEARLYHDALEKVQEATRQLSRVFPVLTELWRINSQQ